MSRPRKPPAAPLLATRQSPPLADRRRHGPVRAGRGSKVMPVVTLYPAADDELARKIRRVLELNPADTLIIKGWDVPLMRALVAQASPLRSSVHAGARKR